MPCRSQRRGLCLAARKHSEAKPWAGGEKHGGREGRQRGGGEGRRLGEREGAEPHSSPLAAVTRFLSRFTVHLCKQFVHGKSKEFLH